MKPNIQRRIVRILLGASAMLVLNACGQKGPLRLPGTPEKAHITATAYTHNTPTHIR